MRASPLLSSCPTFVGSEAARLRFLASPPEHMQSRPCIPTRLPSKRVGVPLTAQSRPAFQNLILHQKSFDSLKPLFLLPSSPHADKGPSHAHTINPRRATHVHILRAIRWGIDARTPPPPPPHRHPRLPGALRAAAGLQPPPAMSAPPPVGLRERERREVGKGGA